MLRVIKIKGFSFETADDEDIDLKKMARNNLFKGMASGSFSMYFHTIRRKEKGFPDGEMPDLFSHRLNEAWSSKHSSGKTFINEHYLTIVRGKESSGIGAIKNLLKKLQYKTDKLSWENDMRDAFDELEEMTSRVINGFSSYRPELLSLKKTENGVFSELLEFLGRLVNANYSQPMSVPTMDLANYLPISRMFFWL